MIAFLLAQAERELADMDGSSLGCADDVHATRRNVFIPVARIFSRPIIALSLRHGTGDDLGSGEAAIALLESLMAFMERKKMISSEEIMQIYDGALQRIQARADESRPDKGAIPTASELLLGGLKR